MNRPDRTLILAAVCLLAGLGTLVYTALLTAEAVASLSWPAGTGTVLSAEVLIGSGGTGTARSTTYTPYVRYTYEVDGSAYTGDRLTFANAAQTRSHAQALIAPYQPGQPVREFFDPRDPARSVLEPGPNTATLLPAGFGLALLAVGAVFLARARRRSST